MTDQLTDQVATMFDRAMWDALTGEAGLRHRALSARVAEVLEATKDGNYTEMRAELAEKMAESTHEHVDIYEALIFQVAKLPLPLRCPFCKSAASIFRELSDRDGPGASGVRCNGSWPDGCGVKLMVPDLLGRWGIDWAGFPCAIKQWNSR